MPTSLGLLEQLLVDLAVGIDLALHHAVLDGLARLIGDARQLGGIGGLEHTLALLGPFVIALDAADDVGALAIQGAFQVGDLGLELAHLIMRGRIDGGLFGVLAAEVRELGLVIAQAAVVEHLGQGLGGRSGGDLISGLLVDAVRLGIGERFLDGLETVVVHALLVAGENEAGILGIGLEAVLRILQAAAEALQLAGQPVGSSLRRLPHGLDVEIDVILGEAVGKGGGEARIGRIASDLDNAAVVHQLDQGLRRGQLGDDGSGAQAGRSHVHTEQLADAAERIRRLFGGGKVTFEGRLDALLQGAALEYAHLRLQVRFRGESAGVGFHAGDGVGGTGALEFQDAFGLVDRGNEQAETQTGGGAEDGQAGDEETVRAQELPERRQSAAVIGRSRGGG